MTSAISRCLTIGPDLHHQQPQTTECAYSYTGKDSVASAAIHLEHMPYSTGGRSAMFAPRVYTAIIANQLRLAMRTIWPHASLRRMPTSAKGRLV